MGLPCQAAASTRNGRVEPGQNPVQALRTSDAANEFHCGVAGCNKDGSIWAAANKGAQSGCADAFWTSLDFSGGMARNLISRPLGSSSTLIIPDVVVRGSVSLTTPGTSSRSW